MNDILFLTTDIYAFAIFISMLVAVMIRVIVFTFDFAQETPEEPTPVAVPQIVEAEEVPVAAIAAAVYTVMGPHRIVNIKPASKAQDWKSEGRSSHHRSHNIPRRR